MDQLAGSPGLSTYLPLLATSPAELVALADTNPARLAAHNRRLGELGVAPVPTYAADDFTGMLAKERVDAVVVSTVDATHDRYIVAALDAGCDVIVEKPMTTDEEKCRRVLDAARRRDRGLPFARQSSIAKLVATDAAMKVTTDAVQVLGGYGYTKDFPVERQMREAKVMQIFEGTNQIQRMVIARDLARSP